jgi:uncharacterized membrane protein
VRRGLLSLTAPLAALGIVLATAAAFVFATGWSLPPTVASHFGPGGVADGFMSRQGYVTFMLAMMVGMAVLFVWVPRFLRLLPAASFNLPNRDYWLAPERRDATLDDLEGRLRWLACAVLALLAYVHWLVVQANAIQPPVLPQQEFLVGLGGFLVAVTAWIVLFLERFRRPPA